MKNYVIYVVDDVDHFGWIVAYGTDGIDYTKNHYNARKMNEEEIENCVKTLDFIGIKYYHIFEW